MRTLPYGSWPSPLSPEDLTRSAVRLSPGLIEGECTYWSQGDPQQRGRVGLWRRDAAGIISELTPQAYVRTAVNEYGGGDWSVAEGFVAYSSWPDGAVYLIEPGQDPRIIGPGDGLRYACLSFDLSRRLVLAVREDHRGQGEPQQSIVSLALDSPNADGGRVLACGSDFYAHPSLSADGRLAWCEWNQPDMPWDQSRIMVAPLTDLTDQVVVEAGARVSNLYPAWAPDGALIYLSDSSGYWNFRRWTNGSTQSLHQEPYDFCGPLWVLTPVPYALIDAGRIGCTWTVDGFAKLGVLDFTEQPARLTVANSAAVSAEVSGRGTRCLALLGYADRPSELVDFDWDGGPPTPLRATSALTLDSGTVSVAEAFSWQSEDGWVHAWFYPPTNAECTAPPGELAPVQVWSHGGPTAFSSPSFNPAVQFWTSRGIGILDVNYSGSTGYGRAYRERLNGAWGLSDVRDCVQGALALVRANRADRQRLSIRGSSAGGFTTLAALTNSDVFTAGISLYGIGDLELLATDTHKFEARYLDRLVAPYPAGQQVYRDRSPIHHLDRLSCPMLILQGADDKVVAPSQAQEMAAAVSAKGMAVRLSIFEGEGHGFRKSETIVAVARQSLDFLAAVHRFVPST
jgi:dienelactone hydrolase